MTTRGFLLGKFLPPHHGHVLLCEFARACVDHLTILVCSLPDDPIDGDLRHRWMQELFPTCRVLHLDRVVPQTPEDHPQFWEIWRAIVREKHPKRIDMVFASEAYGVRLAAEVNAHFVPVDPCRLAVPVSGTLVRQDPYACWDQLPDPVRAHFVKTVCLFGPESSGKTTLATALAASFQTVSVPEYGRTYTEVFGSTLDEADLVRIASRQHLLAEKMRVRANRILICDTDPLLTAVWAEMLLGRRVSALETPLRTCDLYLLTAPDFAWVDDGTRYFAEAATRQRFFALCQSALESRALPHVVLTGDHATRSRQAMLAIGEHFPFSRRGGKPTS